MFNNTFYVDDMGYEISYYFGERELGYVSHTEIFWYFNGFMLLVVL